MKKMRTFSIISTIILLLMTGACSSSGEAGKPLQGSVHSKGFAGPGQVLLEPKLLPEGSSPHLSGTREVMATKDTASWVSVNLRSFRVIRAIVVQSEFDDEYEVVFSKDGFTFYPLWDVPPGHTGLRGGLRTRWKELPISPEAQFVAIRPKRTQKGYREFVLARLHIYSELPASWPPKLDYSLSGSRLPLFPALNTSRAGILISFMTTLVLAVLIWSVLSHGSGENKTQRTVRRRVLFVVFIATLLAWPNFMNFHLGRAYHMHDFFHYYMGAKYHKELGYNLLYECTALAEQEQGVLNNPDSLEIRDLRTNTPVPLGPAIQNSDCRSHFNKSRWEEFTSDTMWFRNKHLNGNIPLWNSYKLDHGFNATPAWMIVGTPLANMVPLSEGAATVLSMLDLLLVLATFIFIARFFGLEPAVAAGALFCLSGISSFLIKGGSFLQFGWFFCLTAGICALRQERDRTAGAFLAAAASLRVFPGVVFLGLALNESFALLRKREFRSILKYKNLLIGAVVAFLIILVTSVAIPGHSTSWSKFYANSKKHMHTDSSNFVGVKFFLAKQINPTRMWYQKNYDANDSSLEARQFRSVNRNRTIIYYLLTLGYVALFLYASRNREPWVTAVLSIGLLPFLLTLSHYYYVVLSLFALLWRVRPSITLLIGVLAWLTWLPVFLLHDLGTEVTVINFLSLLFVFSATALIALQNTGHTEKEK